MEEPKSKSQKKREAETLKKIGIQLISLSPAKLKELPLPPPLLQAILDAKHIKSHGAIRRQAQLIGKLMRAADSEAIVEAFAGLMAEDEAKTAVFHDLEHWRERLIHGGNDALTEFIDQYQPQDIQQLRHLVKKAIDEKNNNKQLGASKALFRFLRACI
ncbi:ribosome biogenesis factor YjgA [Legionella jordanis]|uniref:Alpha helix protein n=1 Tax=Legionella jordanis TaxID=456 RepID=A0A0W0VCJ6_9GAMM|nr:ribosome biogenesis factor YjgA [Legionella jordanis]KTD17858.1 alpha helix protein [Legionella jordanis]RMX02443.1 DUF615 domain-containing protein [Legionella jordanis]RMX21714.1 DUF615 domain-containing protein [Legionella jordanis]VEH11205.1 alpha helix protein [Legionella jordanis]